MVIDTSALVAVFADEPERLTFIEATDLRRLSAANLRGDFDDC